MRLQKLKIKEFKNLKDFEITFDNSLTTVIVGRNGTGKSNVLEALVIIFRDLDLNDDPQFAYELKYETRLNGQQFQIHVDADPERALKRHIKVNGETVTNAAFYRTRRQYLPRYLFGYYSGPSNRLEQHFEKHQEKFYGELISAHSKPDHLPLRPLLYARHVHSQFVLLAFFYEKDKKTLNFLRNHLRIEGLDSVLFVMREPPWNSKEGDDRFWKARGIVADFLSQLYKLALAPIRQDHRIQLGFRRSTTKEHLYLYLPDETSLKQLAQHYDRHDNPSQEFFKALESTYISQLISEVRIRVRVRNADGSLTFQELSEGEQQLVTVLGLLRFTQEEESLFFLDEPDTHLNPAWSMQYLDFLKEVVGTPKSSHIIMTTHDPLVLANLSKEQLCILRFSDEEDNDDILVGVPEKDPYLMGYSAILTSNIFALRSISTPRMQRLLTEKRELLINEERTLEEQQRLDHLNEMLDEMDFSKVVRDPLYEPFVRGMTAIEKEHPELKEPVLTDAQIEKRQKLADELLARLRKQREEGS